MEAATGAELATVSGFVGRVDVLQVIADRLARRLEDQLRRGGPVKDSVGWLIGKGLPQRQECGDKLCDDRMLLDSGRDCPRCEGRQASSRARRLAVAAAVDTAMPYASETERRTATEQQLHDAGAAHTAADTGARWGPRDHFACGRRNGYRPGRRLPRRLAGRRLLTNSLY
ncbi:hypothetical protein [Streptomyces sp. NPDC001642]|uniref:hypothetical protein n=1 Tax=Streptomyces sp. NPDC001642 TaxID=3154392 RepID=UPI003329B43B